MTIDNLTKSLRKHVFPHMTLCTIEFDNGESINDYIPNEVFADATISSVRWWTEQNKGTYIPLITGAKKVTKVTPIEKH